MDKSETKVGILTWATSTMKSYKNSPFCFETTQTNFTLGDFDASVPHLQSHLLLYEVSSTTNSAAKQRNPSFHFFQGKALPFLITAIAIGVQGSVEAKISIEMG